MTFENRAAPPANVHRSGSSTKLGYARYRSRAKCHRRFRSSSRMDSRHSRHELERRGQKKKLRSSAPRTWEARHAHVR
jgi:hypothetical protein